jgi:hypothetical protein
MPAQILYSSSVQKILNDVRTVDEEFIIRGEKGLKIKYYQVRGTDIEKIVITGKDSKDTKDSKYMMKKTVNGKTTESELDAKDLVKELKSPKLAFAKEYMKDVLKGGKR